MAEPISSAAASGIAAAQAIGSNALAGILGAALLWMVMPPGRPGDAHTTRKELGREVGVRIVFAGISAAMCGDWVVDMVQSLAPFLLAAKHPTPFLIASGALGWYAGRAVALWIYRRQDRDAGQLIDEIKGDGGAGHERP